MCRRKDQRHGRKRRNKKEERNDNMFGVRQVIPFIVCSKPSYLYCYE